MHYYQFNIADYRKDTTHLSRIEHSIYRDLIDWYYLDESPIPLDLTSVCRRLRIDSTDVERALNYVLTDFFERTENGYVQNRIEQEIIEFHAHIANASKAGKASAEARRIKAKERAFNDRSTNHKPITNNQEPLKSKDIRATHFDAVASLSSLGVDPQIANDWIQHRKSIKASVTQTVINGLVRESAKARIALSDAMAMTCERGWRGFKADWVSEHKPINGYKSERQERDSAFLSAIGLSTKPREEKLITGELL
jgi:uncharacterized protein YdaU (DUF1376 family)